MATKNIDPLLVRILLRSCENLAPSETPPFVRMTFTAAERRRITQLCERNQDTGLIKADRAELDEYLYVGKVLALVHARVRRSLGVTNMSPTRRKAS